VFGFLPEPGALAEIITLPAAMVDVTPAAVADVDAASMVVSFLTADAAAVTVGRLEKGEAVLVTAAAGGVGSAAVQLCRLYGAGTIVAAAGTEERRRYAAELGADVVCGYDDILESARAATDGRGVDLVIESVGGTAFDQSFEALTTSGRVISLGISGGERPAKLRLPFLWHRGVSVGGVHLQRLLLERPDLLAHSRRRVWDALERGHVKACVWKSFAPDDVAAAYDALRTRQVLGRAVIDFSV
jgi:NADPH2:quinone reductase